MTLNVGVIGAGSIGRGHVRRCSETLPGVVVVAASDVDTEAARRALASFDRTGRIYDDGRALIAAYEVDAEMAAGRHLVQVGFMRPCDQDYRDLKTPDQVRGP